MSIRRTRIWNGPAILAGFVFLSILSLGLAETVQASIEVQRLRTGVTPERTRIVLDLDGGGIEWSRQQVDTHGAVIKLSGVRIPSSVRRDVSDVGRIQTGELRAGSGEDAEFLLSFFNPSRIRIFTLEGPDRWVLDVLPPKPGQSPPGSSQDPSGSQDRKKKEEQDLIARREAEERAAEERAKKRREAEQAEERRAEDTAAAERAKSERAQAERAEAERADAERADAQRSADREAAQRAEDEARERAQAEEARRAAEREEEKRRQAADELARIEAEKALERHQVTSTPEPERRGPRVVVIDAGHGGHDPGATATGLREKDVCLDVAQRLHRKLSAQPGIHPVLSRSKDVYVPLRKRMRLAEELEADLLVSIHVNAAPVPTAHGVEVFYLSLRGASDEAAKELARSENQAGEEEIVYESSDDELPFSLSLRQSDTILRSSRAAEAVLDVFVDEKLAENRGVRQAAFVVLKSVAVPSILVELGFASSEIDREKLKTERHREALAEAMSDGLTEYFRDFAPERGTDP